MRRQCWRRSATVSDAHLACDRCTATMAEVRYELLVRYQAIVLLQVLPAHRALCVHDSPASVSVLLRLWVSTPAVAAGTAQSVAAVDWPTAGSALRDAPLVSPPWCACVYPTGAQLETP